MSFRIADTPQWHTQHLVYSTTKVISGLAPGGSHSHDNLPYVNVSDVKEHPQVFRPDRPLLRRH